MEYHNQIKLGLSNKNQLILASNMGPNHQRYVDFPLFCLSFWFWATCRPNGAAIINRNTMYTGRDCSRKIWDNSLWRWICSSVATMMLCLLFDAAVLGRIVLDRTAAKYEGGGGGVHVVDGKIRGSVSHVGTVLWVRSQELSSPGLAFRQINQKLFQSVSSVDFSSLTVLFWYIYSFTSFYY